MSNKTGKALQAHSVNLAEGWQPAMACFPVRLLRSTLLLCALLTLSCPVAYANEYFVSPSGCDLNDGVLREKPLATIGKGVSLLKAGDVLTILPGEYCESISAKISGTEKEPITIKADRPGTVLIKGYVDAPPFKKLEGFRFIWSCDYAGIVQIVNEFDTLSLYDEAPSVASLDNMPNAYFHDEAAGKLYVHTSDSEPPSRHYVTISAIRGFGLLLDGNVSNVVVDGLAFAGFNNSSTCTGGVPRTYLGYWGLYIRNGKNCVVRNCVAFFNGGGIVILNPDNCVAENNLAYANGSTFADYGGNIMFTSGEPPAKGSILRKNISYKTLTNPIRIYGNEAQNCLMEDNIAWGEMNGFTGIKVQSKSSRAEGNIVLGAFASLNAKNCIFSNNAYEESGPDCINTSKEKLFSPFDEFADPLNLDFRLQSDSRFKGALADGGDRGPFIYKDEVFFVKTDGDDSQEGTSVARAWKTVGKALKEVKPGQTVYVLAGQYAEDLMLKVSGEQDKPVTISSRAGAMVEITGKVEISNVANIRIRGLTTKFFGTTDSKNIEISNCVINGSPVNGFDAKNVDGLVVVHNLIKSCAGYGVALEKCSAIEISGNIFAENAKGSLKTDVASAKSLYCDYNSHGNGKNRCFCVIKDEYSLPEWRMSMRMDTNSIEFKAEFVDGKMINSYAFEGRGKFATDIGPFYHYRIKNDDLTIQGPFVHTVAATAVDIEWWTSRGDCTTELEWGDTPECANKTGTLFYGSAYHTVSLTGLVPGKTYFYKVSSMNDPREYHSDTDLEEQDKQKKRAVVSSGIRTFETVKTDAPAGVYHVAVDGADSQDGLSINRAWRSIAHAASRVKAGDKVVVHEGTYSEIIPVRATGTKERPVSFVAAEGERVTLDGKRQTMPYSFMLMEKSYINIDGFYLHDFNSNKGHAGIMIIGGEGVTVTRCFYDGRSETYTPPFIYAAGSKDLTIRNCVWTRGFHGASFYRCPNLRIENCVFYVNQIGAVDVYNLPEEKLFLSHNIFVDNIPQKYLNPIVWVWQLECVNDDYNCYLMRKGEEKPLYNYIRKAGVVEEKKLTWKEFVEATEQGKTSFFANPQLKIIKDIMTFPDDNFKKINEKHAVEEYKFNSQTKTYAPLCFEDFFAANPKCVKADDGKPIGLDQDAFKKKSK